MDCKDENIELSYIKEKFELGYNVNESYMESLKNTFLNNFSTVQLIRRQYEETISDIFMDLISMTSSSETKMGFMDSLLGQIISNMNLHIGWIERNKKEINSPSSLGSNANIKQWAQRRQSRLLPELCLLVFDLQKINTYLDSKVMRTMTYGIGKNGTNLSYPLKPEQVMDYCTATHNITFSEITPSDERAQSLTSSNILNLYDKYKLKTLEKQVLFGEHISYPMIAIAILIDFSLIPLIFIIVFVKRSGNNLTF